MDVREMIEAYLKDNGYGGLFNPNEPCGCCLDELFRCDDEQGILACEAGYERMKYIIAKRGNPNVHNTHAVREGEHTSICGFLDWWGDVLWHIPEPFELPRCKPCRRAIKKAREAQ